MTLILVALCFALFALLVWERYQAIVREDAWRLERVGLLQRIQAPELAVAAHTERPETGPVQTISALDDQTFNKVREQRGEAA